MKIIQNPVELQRVLLGQKQKGIKIGIVPTMGNLHAGHLSLIETAKENVDIVVSSIFVNPLQFGPNEDFENYPRTLDADIEKLKEVGTDFLFLPTIDDIYPDGQQSHTSVSVNRMTDKLCGASRPGHFLGVTTVVNILFNIVQPNVAVFGKKDYQQYRIIKAMVKDLRMPIEIIGGEIVRESNGLAMSSRNGYLSDQEKSNASLLRKIIIDTAKKIKDPNNAESFTQLKESSIARLTEHGFKVDYFELVRQSDLENATPEDKSILIAAAAWLGQPRLIDNLELDLDS